VSHNDSLKHRLGEAAPAERKAILDQQPYDVGFGKPPKHTRFSSSRQPARRRRGRRSETILDLVRKELSTRIEVVENGKPRRRSKGEVIFRQLVNKAAVGEDRALKLLFDLLRNGGLMPPVGASSGGGPIKINVEQSQADLVAMIRRLAEQTLAERKRKTA